MTRARQVLNRVAGCVRGMSAYDTSRPSCRIRLDGNESPFTFPEPFRTKMLDGVLRVSLNRYPDPHCLELRPLVAEQNGICPESIVFGNGSDELIQMVLSAFCGGTQTALFPTPTFSMYGLIAQSLGKKVVRVRLDNEFDLDTDAMLKAVETGDPDVVFLASPNSPTGNVLSYGKVESVIAHSPGLVVVDEAYFDFCGKTHIPLMEKYENLAVMRTLSKVGFAGIRLGFICMRPELAVELSKVRLPYNINSFTQKVARLFFENSAIFEKNTEIIKTEREKMFDSLRSIEGIKLFPSDANFFLIRFAGEEAADRVRLELIERSILVRGFHGSDISDCLRVTIGLPEENRKFEKALCEIVSAAL